MNKVTPNIDFLTKKVLRSKEELNQDMSESKRAELLEYQDRLMDSLFEESARIRNTKDPEAMECLLTRLEEIRG
jgi:hypothetical protein